MKLMGKNWGFLRISICQMWRRVVWQSCTDISEDFLPPSTPMESKVPRKVHENLPDSHNPENNFISKASNFTFFSGTLYFVFYYLSVPWILYIIYTTVISARWEYKAVVWCRTKILFIFLHFRNFTKNIVMCIPNKLWLLVAEYTNEIPRARGVTPDIYVVGSRSFRPDQLFKVTEIKQLCYFST